MVPLGVQACNCLVALARQSKRPIVAASSAERAAVVVEFICKQPDLLFPVVAVDEDSLASLPEGRAILVAPLALLPRLATGPSAGRLLVMYDVPPTAAQYLHAAEGAGIKLVAAFTTPGREGARVAQLLRELRCVHGVRHTTLANPLDA